MKNKGKKEKYENGKLLENSLEGNLISNFVKISYYMYMFVEEGRNGVPSSSSASSFSWLKEEKPVHLDFSPFDSLIPFPIKEKIKWVKKNKMYTRKRAARKK